MRKISSFLLVAVFSLGLLMTSSFAEEAAKETKAKDANKAATPSIELAILLDTSGSMEGLINQARTQIWKIVNELATAKQNGQVPEMKVALYEYGKSSLSAKEGYLRQIVPLTDDLDTLSEELFALKTNGGEEYCGHVIQAAVSGLKWSNKDSDLKLIFIAGNEPFTQGSVDYKTSCAMAIKKGITVNTIFCGPEAEGIRTQWKAGSLLADGAFLSINQGQRVAAIKTPYDVELSKLGSNVNSTYLFYGRRGLAKEAAKKQKAADYSAGNAAPAASAQRAAFKGSGRYRAKNDIIDAIASKKLKLKDIKEEELPAELKKLDKKERMAYVEKKSQERTAIQKKIQDLNKKRNAYIAAERKKQASKSTSTFDSAVIKVIRTQAAKKKFKFEEK